MYEIEIRSEKKSFRQSAIVTEYEKNSVLNQIDLSFHFYSDLVTDHKKGDCIITTLFDSSLFSIEGDSIISCDLIKDDLVICSKHFKELPLPLNHRKKLRVNFYYNYRGE